MTAVTPLNLFKLDGKTALITGASGGLGEVFAHTLAAAGADIILVGRRLDPLEAMATTLRALYGRTITTYAADVTDVAQIDAMVQAVGTAAASGMPIAWAGAAGFIASGWALTKIEAGQLGYISLPALAGLAIFSVAAAPYGARLAHRLPARRLKQCFAALLASVGVWMLYS